MVGYQNKAAVGGSLFSFTASTFERVDGESMTLGDLQLIYTGEEVSETSQNIWTLDQGGATKHAYYYVNRQAAIDNWGCETEEEIADAVGWYSDLYCTEKADDTPMPYGQGFAVVSADPIDVAFNGAVRKGEATVDIVGGSLFNFSGNILPVDYTLGDLALIYTGEEVSETSQNIWTLDQGGATKHAYYYVNEQAAIDNWGCETPEEIADAVGWYSDLYCTEKANDEPMPAGQGFAIVSADSIQLWVPSPLK